jgi:Fe2+ or Zn2+ uptake regulation protein
MVPGSGRELTLSAVLASPKPLSAAEAVAAVKRRDPKVKARAVYGALHEFAQKGRISSEMKGKKAVYFKPKG